MYLRTEKEIINNWEGDITRPIVSICCGTYNHENYISDAIEGFLMQETDFPFEIIIRDDCSTDRTAKIVKQYAERYPQLIKTIFEQENQYSKGVKHLTVTSKQAVGEYIALCEGDDYWTTPSKLQKQADFLISNPLYYGCFHDCTILYEKKENNKKPYLRIGKRIIDKDVDLTSLIDENNIAAASIMFKNFIDEIPKYWRETIKGDYALMITIAAQGKIKYLPEVMSVYRVHEGGVWSCRTEMYKAKEDIKFYHLLQEHFVDDSHTLKALSRKLKYTYYSLSRKLAYDKQRLKSFYYMMLSLDFLHPSHPNIKYYIYFKELLKSIIK